MRRLTYAVAIPFLLALALHSPAASAQSETEFVAAFSGTWQAIDPALSDGSGLCTITFDPASVDGKYAAGTRDCSALLSPVKRWAIVEGQLNLMTEADAIVAKIGGNQRRLTGDAASGDAIIIERNGGDGTAGALQSALNASGCLFLGYTDQCAAAGDEGKPVFNGKTGNVRVLVDLNARAEARSNAPVIGVVRKDTCLAVNQCLLATDGVWCRAPFGGQQGWVKKLAIRQSKWPVITFTNQC